MKTHRAFLVHGLLIVTVFWNNYLPAAEPIFSNLAMATSARTGKLGIIGDSIAAGTHASEMCGNNDTIDCISNVYGVQSRDWSYAGGTRRWSIASLLGYGPGNVVDASDNGAEWKDALEQAQSIMTKPEVTDIFIGLGANNVCKSYGASYVGDLETIAQHIDATLNYLTDILPSGSRIYWSGVPDVLKVRELMLNRDHNYIFENCQAIWDLDGTKIKDGIADDVCDHFFSRELCQYASYNEQAKDRLLKIIIQKWLEIEGVEEGSCGKILNRKATDQDRQEAYQFSIALNQLMAQKAQAYNGRNGIAVYFSDRIFTASSTFEPYHVSRLDCYHPSRSGQMKLAYEIWKSFDYRYNLKQRLFLDEFDSQDYCNQELTVWNTCWMEINEANGPWSGDIQTPNQELRVKDNNKGIERGVDLADVEEAWVSFNWRREDLDNQDEYVSFDISPDGGQTWHTLDRFRGDGSDYGMLHGYYYDITVYATAQTRIRWLSSDRLGDQDKVYFDNVNIAGYLAFPAALDFDGDSIPDTVEVTLGTNPAVKDNDVFQDNRLFTMQQYRDLLNREGDDGGIAYWTNQIANGLIPRSGMIEAFLNSVEFGWQIAPVIRLYFAYFGFIPDDEVLQYWLTLFKAGTSLVGISAALADSSAFRDTYGNLADAEFVTLVYKNVLGRDPDSGGFNFWTALLTSGLITRSELMLAFSESMEYQGLIDHEIEVTMLYVGMLQRSPQVEEFTFWVSQLDNGASPQGLIEQLLQAPIYYHRFLP